MSHPLKKQIIDTVWDFLVTAMLSCSLALLWSLTLTGPGGNVRVMTVSLLCSAAVSLIDHWVRGKWKLLAFGGILVLAVGSYFLRVGPVYEMVQSVKALLLRWRGAGSALSLYAGDLRVFFSLVCALLCYTQVRDDAFGAAAFLYVFLAAVCFLLRQYPSFPVHVFPLRDGIRLLLPGICGLLWILSAHSGRTLRVLAAAALIVFLAFLFMPGQGTVSQPLNRLAREVSGAFQTAVLNVQRDAFSISAAGFGGADNTLGGKAVPGRGKVLRVNGAPGESVYLRGWTCDTYTGYSWEDRLSDGGKLFDLFLERDRRDALFDLTKHFGLASGTLTVHALADGASTVFAPQRLCAFLPTSDLMTLYYNEGTELFLSRNLAAGDEYQVEYIPLDADDPATAALVSAQESAGDGMWAEVTDRYLTIPGHMPQEVYALAYEAAGSGTPLEKALHIRNYLVTHYTYTLNTDDVPAAQDFVTWFLMSEKEGYCTYFASAMTLMCRMNGIPARYTAGYHCVLDGEGQAEVTLADAHAWTEIYLNGFGWLTMDATPGEAGSGSDVGGSARTSSPSPSPTPSPTPTPIPTATPSASPSPSVSPEAGVSEAPSSGPTDRGMASPAPSPRNGGSVAPSASPSETAAPRPGSADREWNKGRFLFWLLLLLLLGLIVCRAICISPLRRAKRHPEKAGEILMKASVQALHSLKLPPGAGETWLAYGGRLSESGIPSAREAFAKYSAFIYGNDAMDAAAAENLYGDVRSRLNLFAMVGLAIRRFFTFRA